MKKDAQNVLMSFCLVIAIAFGGGISYFEKSYEESMGDIAVANYNLKSVLSNRKEREEKEERERIELEKQEEIERQKSLAIVADSGIAISTPLPVYVPPVVVTPTPVKQPEPQVVVVKPSRSSRAS